MFCLLLQKFGTIVVTRQKVKGIRDYLGDPPVHLPRPKNSPQGCFCPAGRGRGVATCGYRIRLRPLGGACLLRPLRLLRLPVSAAGGGRLRSRLFDSRTPLLLTMYNKKKEKSSTSCEVELFGDPYGNRTSIILQISFNAIRTNDNFITGMDFIKGYFYICVVQSVVLFI